VILDIYAVKYRNFGYQYRLFRLETWFVVCVELSQNVLSNIKILLDLKNMLTLNLVVNDGCDISTRR
jgi:hypothetical protein